MAIIRSEELFQQKTWSMQERSLLSIRRKISLAKPQISTTGTSGSRALALRENSNTSSSPTLYMVRIKSNLSPASRSGRASAVDSTLWITGGLLRFSSA